MSNEAANPSLNVEPIDGTGSVKHSIRAFENLGKINVQGCAVLASTGASLVGKEDQMNLYDGPIDPSDRKKNRIWTKDVKDGDGGCYSRDTGRNWGSGFFVGYFAKDHQTDDFVLVAQAGPTEA
ncbi:MAG: hypothetical protein AAGF23_14730 [Acidobacteriota bacterium]